MYSMSVLTGVGAILFTPQSMTPAAWLIIVAMLVFGLACLVGTLVQNYIIEWVSLFFLTAGLSLYVVSVWFTAFSAPTRIAGAASLTMLILALSIRLVDLTVYWLKNVKAAKIARDLDSDD